MEQPVCCGWRNLSALMALVAAAWTVSSAFAEIEAPGEGVVTTAAGKPAEGSIEPFLGEPRFDKQQLFADERFPNVVVATDGTVLATWGSRSYKVRRSEDGGTTWESATVIADAPAYHGGGVIVDEHSGDVLVFVDEVQPNKNTPQKTMGPLKVYRSGDHGKSWEEQQVRILPDVRGNVPSMHMAEAGISLRHGKHAGRLTRPARVYDRDTTGGYNTAIYSDDGGSTWQSSTPFPAYGTGEGAVAELSNGRIYYNSRRNRRHSKGVNPLIPEGVNLRMRWTAWSDDGGATWGGLAVSEVLPDGDQNNDYGLMAGLVRLPIRGRDILVFSNIVSPGGRRNGHVWASFDGGHTWPVKRVVDEGSFGYSSLSAGRPGTSSEGWIYLLYEGSGGGRIARFNLAWLLEGEPTGDGEVPELKLAPGVGNARAQG